jgi:deoxyribodipyrimidine photo-lyase
MEAFPTDYQSILQKIDQIDPIKYGKTRNYIDGAVTYLSPYISRGVISTNQVLNHVLKKGFALKDIESFVKELCWRDYFQRVAQHNNVDLDIKNPQSAVSSKNFPKSVLTAQTGILAIDQSIKKLYASGYMHNHERMYLASIICNIAQYYWNLPSKWMYYHLLDGDFASNSCSWQWVAGANSSKKYYANQENINTYTKMIQKNTFLDCDYESLENIPIPSVLTENDILDLQTELPKSNIKNIEPNWPTYIYNYYNLDPLWGADINANRILLLEPDFFSKFPVSEKCIQFVLDLSKNIKNIQIFTGSFKELESTFQPKKVVYKEHPLNKHYKGIEVSRDWICESVTEYFPSFFSYWKKISPLINTSL